MMAYRTKSIFKRWGKNECNFLECRVKKSLMNKKKEEEERKEQVEYSFPFWFGAFG